MRSPPLLSDHSPTTSIPRRYAEEGASISIKGMQATANSVSSCLELGDLPVGVYRATLAEVVAHLGHGTVQRVAITARLERIYELARRTSSVQRLTASGARSQRRPNPRDIDVFLVMQGG